MNSVCCCVLCVVEGLLLSPPPAIEREMSYRKALLMISALALIGKATAQPPQCAADFGAGVGDPVCCGQPGYIEPPLDYRSNPTLKPKPKPQPKPKHKPKHKHNPHPYLNRKTLT